jgi:hypothetical protein
VDRIGFNGDPDPTFRPCGSGSKVKMSKKNIVTEKTQKRILFFDKKIAIFVFRRPVSASLKEALATEETFSFQ